MNLYVYHQSQFSNTWDSKCVALIVQVVRAYGMNPKVGGSPRVETFSVSKMSTLSKEQLFRSRDLMLLSMHINISNVNFTEKNMYIYIYIP